MAVGKLLSLGNSTINKGFGREDIFISHTHREVQLVLKTKQNTFFLCSHAFRWFLSPA